MRAKQRLSEWALWRLEPGFWYPQQTPLQRIKDDEKNAGAGSNEFHYDIIEVEGESVACMPDGGLGEMVERMAGAIDHDNRCREIDELVNEMRVRFRDYWNLVDATFTGTHPRDVMRAAPLVAAMLGIDANQYRTRMRAVYEWVEVRLGMREAA